MMRGLFYMVGLLMLSPSLQAYDAYLQLSKNGKPVLNDGNHAWVQILGFSQGVENTVGAGSTPGGGGSGKVTADTVTLQMAANGSIAEMHKGVATGGFYEIKLQLARRNAEGYTGVMTEIIFSKVLFSKVVSRGAAGDDIIPFDISFKYGELRVTHTLTDNDGRPISPTSAGWDFVGNQAISVNSTIPELGDYEGVTKPPANSDRDGDLIPNDWETQYGLNPDNKSDAGQDPDSDGFTNLLEYIAGTHPREGTSFFKVETTLTSGSPTLTVELTWNAIAGRTYNVEAATNLTSGFTSIHTIIPAANGVQTFQPAAGAGPFFRLAVKK